MPIAMHQVSNTLCDSVGLVVLKNLGSYVLKKNLVNIPGLASQVVTRRFN